MVETEVTLRTPTPEELRKHNRIDMLGGDKGRYQNWEEFIDKELKQFSLPAEVQCISLNTSTQALELHKFVIKAPLPKLGRVALQMSATLLGSYRDSVEKYLHTPLPPVNSFIFASSALSDFFLGQPTVGYDSNLSITRFLVCLNPEDPEYERKKAKLTADERANIALLPVSYNGQTYSVVVLKAPADVSQKL